MVSIPDPHGPDSSRPPYDTMYKAIDEICEKPKTYDKTPEQTPKWGAVAPKCTYKMADYLEMVKCIDDNVGKILDCLRSNKLIDDTIVVFTSDHGDLRGEHRRQNKGVPYEGSAKVPFVIYSKGKIKPGTVVNEALGCVDFLPTVLSLMGVKTAGLEEGRDASAIFTEGKAPAGWKDIAFIRSTGGNESDVVGWLAAVTPRYKFIVSGAEKPWLFDLQKDPDELDNHCYDPKYRETVRELARDLIAYGRKHNDPYITNARVKADLAWAADGKGEYVAPAAPAAAAKKARKKA
jgi:arylsulfatase A-like enzyme